MSAGINKLEEWQKCIHLLLDEMHIREDQVYEKHTGALIGFTEINNHLLAFEHSLNTDESTPGPLSKSMMVFMARGLFTNLHFLYAQFPCTTITETFCLTHSGKQCFGWKGVVSRYSTL